MILKFEQRQLDVNTIVFLEDKRICTVTALGNLIKLKLASELSVTFSVRLLEKYSQKYYKKSTLYSTPIRTSTLKLGVYWLVHVYRSNPDMR